MDRLTLPELDGLGPEVEDLVDRTPGADRWCSSPDWIVPAHLAFAPEAAPLVLRDAGRLALLARYRTADGVPVIGGLEPLWGFACPLLGEDLAATARLVATALADDRAWDLVVLPGLPWDQAALRAVAAELAVLGPVRASTGITRQVADLAEGLDAFWARRSSRFRRNLARARRQAAAAGLDIEDASADEDLIDRLLAVERRSWKGRSGDGLVSPPMTEFYRRQLDRLRPAGRVRALLARLDGADVGFIVGGRRGAAYRGLQLSFVESVAELSVGHLLQAAEIGRLAAEGVGTYDLGMDLEYKRRWADHAVTTVNLVVQRPSAPGRPLR